MPHLQLYHPDDLPENGDEAQRKITGRGLAFYQLKDPRVSRAARRLLQTATDDADLILPLRRKEEENA